MSDLLPKYEVKQLPSRFIGYPKGTRIFAKPYTAGQAINIELIGRANVNTMDEILEGIVVEGIENDDLSPQDILFLGVYRNLASSKHDKIKITSICPKCLQENESVKTLSSIKFKELEGFDDECYPIEVDFDNYTMHFEFLTYKAFKYVMTHHRGSKMYQLATQVVDYTDKSTGESYTRPWFTNDPNERKSTSAFKKYLSDVRNILFNLVDEDKDALDEVINLLEDYGTKPIEVECSDENCKHKYEVGLNEEGVLVVPFREVGESNRVRIKLRKDNIDKSIGIQKDESEGIGDNGGKDTRTSTEETDKSVRVNETVKRKIIKGSSPADEQIHYFN